MTTFRKCAATAVVATALLSGCTSAQEFSFQSPTTDKPRGTTAGTAIDYATALASQYMKAAGYTADGQQLLDITMIGAGTAAAGATAFGWSNHLLKVAALTAGAALGVRSYENGDGKIKALVNGAAALRCVANVLNNVPDIAPTDLRNKGELPLDAWEAIDAIEARVAAQIMRQTAPDFTALAKTMAEQVNNAGAKKQNLAGAYHIDFAANPDANAAADAWAAAPAKLTACIGKAG